MEGRMEIICVYSFCLVEIMNIYLQNSGNRYYSSCTFIHYMEHQELGFDVRKMWHHYAEYGVLVLLNVDTA